ncbi:MAG: 30S ribosomal protein S21 [Parcubacteria group bacterium]|nr:30S ribosomal protein S21 [Parcubacteria group bacterium]
MVEVRRKENESVESLLRRFQRRVQQSGKLLRARETRFYTKKKSKYLTREAAKRRTELRKEREELEKLGKWKPGLR